MEESDRNIRYYSTKLLTYLLANRGAEIEAAVLQSPAHITRLMDLLKLGNEMIRNEALLLLIEISKTNIELQKVIAFENGFENLLDIIESEGYSNGGIVVQDCLTLIINLLNGNTSNQNHFREMNCIKRLSELLKVETSDFWTLSDDKRDNLVLTLNVVCALLAAPSSVPVSPQILALACAPPTPSTSHSLSNSHGSRPSSTPSSTSPVPTTSNWVSLLCPVPSIQSTQSQLGTHRVLARTIEIGISQIKAPTVRIKALWALGDQIFCHNENRVYLEQNDFATRSGNGSGRTSAMLKVTQIVFFSKVPMESLAALHVLKCYFHNNPASQRVFAATIIRPVDSNLPQAQQMAQLAEEAYPACVIVGHLAALADPMKTFFASLCLCYILTGNNGVKEQLLKVSFDSPASHPASGPQNPALAPSNSSSTGNQGHPTSATQPFENLLAKLVKWLVQSIDRNSELPIIVGLFRALAAWVEDCPMAANYFRNVSVVSASTGPSPVSIMAYLASLMPQNSNTNSNPNMNFAAGLAAHLYGLALDPTISSTPESLERSQIFQARLDSLRLSPDFVSVERGGSRPLDSESKLPFFDAPFALSLLRLYHTLFPAIPGSHSVSPHPQQVNVAHAPHPNPIVPQRSNNVTPVASLLETHPPASSTPNGAMTPLAASSNGHTAPQTLSPSSSNNGLPSYAHPQTPPVSTQSQQVHTQNATQSSPTQQSNGNASAELDSLRKALAALQQEKSAWQSEKVSLQSQLYQAQNYSAQLQAQLTSATNSNQSLISQLSQLQVESNPVKSNSNDSLASEYERLKAEHAALMSEHEDLLVLLAETQDENDALKSASYITHDNNSGHHVGHDQEAELL